MRRVIHVIKRVNFPDSNEPRIFRVKYKVLMTHLLTRQSYM
jgi:hypothetical protein